MPSQNIWTNAVRLQHQSQLLLFVVLLWLLSSRWPPRYFGSSQKMVLAFTAQTCTYIHGCMVLCCGWKEGLQEQHRSYLMTGMCLCVFLHIAYGIKGEDILSKLFFNSDQTQVVYAQGSKLTWIKTGSQQATIIGDDEKRAFTIVVSVSKSGELLPFQVIYPGYSTKTCSSTSAKDYAATDAASFHFEFSKSKTY
jgi:hypothetical protein